MAKLDIKIIDMVDGEIKKVLYDGAEYVSVEGMPKEGDILQAGVSSWDIEEGGFYSFDRNVRGGYGIRVIDGAGDSWGLCREDVDVFRKVDRPSHEERISGLETRVDALEGADKANLKTEKREAEVGERILVVNAETTAGKYENGDIFTVVELGDAGVHVREHERAIWHSEYQVIVSEEEEPEDPRDEFSKGDQVRLISGGGSYPLNGYYDGEIYEVIEPKYDDHDRSPVIKIKGGSLSTGYAKVHQVELVENSPIEIGDYARVVGDLFYNDIPKGTTVKVTEDPDIAGDQRIELLDGSDYDFAKPESLEKAELGDREQSFLRAEREIDELEVGDIAEVISSPAASPEGTLVEIVEVNTGEIRARGYSARAGKIRTYSYYPKHLKLVCTANNRVDVADSDD